MKTFKEFLIEKYLSDVSNLQQLDEISNKLKASYIKAAAHDLIHQWHVFPDYKDFEYGAEDNYADGHRTPDKINPDHMYDKAVNDMKAKDKARQKNIGKLLDKQVGNSVKKQELANNIKDTFKKTIKKAERVRIHPAWHHDVGRQLMKDAEKNVDKLFKSKK